MGGGGCHYDPYFIYGFGRFGELDMTDPFDVEDLWKIHEIEHLALDEDDPFSHGHNFGDEYFQYDEFDEGMYDQFDELADIEEEENFDEGIHEEGFEEFEDVSYDDMQDVELVD